MIEFLNLSKNSVYHFLLVATFAIVAAYLIRKRKKTVVVPYLEIFNLRAKKHPFLKNFVKWFLSLLSVVIVACFLIFTLSKDKNGFPFNLSISETKKKAKGLTIIIDGTLSMRAVDLSPTRFDRARLKLLYYAEKMPSDYFLKIYRYCGNYEEVYEGYKNEKQIKRVVFSLKPCDVSVDEQEFFAKGEKVLVFSDFVHLKKILHDPHVVPVQVAKSGDNCGIIRGGIRKNILNPVYKTGFFVVKNFGKGVCKGKLIVYDDKEPVFVKRFSIKGGATEKIGFTDVKITTPFVKGVIKPETRDYLPEDNYYFVADQRIKKRKGAVYSKNIYLITALSLRSDIDFDLLPENTAVFCKSSDYDFFVIDSATNLKDECSSRALLVNTLKGFTTLKKDFFSKAKKHPVFKWVNFEKTEVSDIRVLEGLKKRGFSPIAFSKAGIPLVYVNEKKRSVYLNFDLENSEVVFRKTFPVFINNVLNFILKIDTTPNIPLTVEDVSLKEWNSFKNIKMKENPLILKPGFYSYQNKIVAVNFNNEKFGLILREKLEKNAPEVSFEKKESSVLPWQLVLLFALLFFVTEYFTFTREISE